MSDQRDPQHPALHEVLISFQRALGQAAAEAHKEANSRTHLIDGERPVFVIDGLDVDLSGGVSLHPGDSANQVRIDLDAKPDERSRFKVSLRQLATEASDGAKLTLSEFSDRPGSELGVAHLFARDGAGRPMPHLLIRFFVSAAGGQITPLAPEDLSPVRDSALFVRTDGDGVARIEAHSGIQNDGGWLLHLDSPTAISNTLLRISDSNQVTLSAIVVTPGPGDNSSDANEPESPPLRSNRVNLWRGQMAKIEHMRTGGPKSEQAESDVDRDQSESIVQRLLALLLEVIPDARSLSEEELEALLRARLAGEFGARDDQSEA